MVARGDTKTENQENVLFQPERREPVFIPGSEKIEDETTIEESVKIMYDTNVDMTKMTAQRIRCCLCGVIMPPNPSNTCVQCLKS